LSNICLLFVYGSLKRGGKLHHELETLHARFFGVAKIRGELFYIKGKSWPGAVPTSAQKYIHGELYKMTKPAETLKRLDEVEDCKHGLFTRKVVEVWAGNRVLKAWTYFFDHQEEKASRIASGNFSPRQNLFGKD